MRLRAESSVCTLAAPGWSNTCSLCRNRYRLRCRLFLARIKSAFEMNNIQRRACNMLHGGDSAVAEFWRGTGIVAMRTRIGGRRPRRACRAGLGLAADVDVSGRRVVDVSPDSRVRGSDARAGVEPAFRGTGR